MEVTRRPFVRHASNKVRTAYSVLCSSDDNSILYAGSSLLQDACSISLIHENVCKRSVQLISYMSPELGSMSAVVGAGRVLILVS